MFVLILYSLIGGLFSLIGGLLLLLKPKVTKHFLVPLLAFGSGAFMSAVFFDILPEAVESAKHPEMPLLFTFLGFTSFFALERFLMRFFQKHDEDHEHPHSEHTESLPILLILGDSLHNFLDGTVIALAYSLNPAIAFTTTLAVAAHEIPQEIGDFSVFIKAGWKNRDIIAVNILQSLATIPGALLGYYVSHLLAPTLPALLGFAGGIFLYIAASDLIPELHHRSSHKHFFRIIVPFLLSSILIYFLVTTAHGH